MVLKLSQKFSQNEMSELKVYMSRPQNSFQTLLRPQKQPNRAPKSPKSKVTVEVLNFTEIHQVNYQKSLSPLSKLIPPMYHCLRKNQNSLVVQRTSDQLHSFHLRYDFSCVFVLLIVIIFVQTSKYWNINFQIS